MKSKGENLADLIVILGIKYNEFVGNSYFTYH